MVKFDGQAISAALRKKSPVGLLISVCAFLAFVCGIISATVASKLNAYHPAVIVLLAIALVAILALIALIIVNAVTAKKIYYFTAQAVADELCQRKKFLEGGEKIHFTVSFNGHIFSIGREGTNTQVEFDLSPLKKTPSVYSGFGLLILEFINAYYRTNHNTLDVVVTDAIDKIHRDVKIVEGGKPNQTGGNYFLKRGLLQ